MNRDDALSRQRFTTLVGDAGYNSEKAHGLRLLEAVFDCRERLGVRSVFALNPCGRRRLDGQPQRITSRYRRALARRFPQKTYGQRWQMETVFSVLKRHLGSALAARRPHSRLLRRSSLGCEGWKRRKILLRLLTHNLMILLRPWIWDVLYRAYLNPVF